MRRPPSSGRGSGGGRRPRPQRTRTTRVKSSDWSPIMVMLPLAAFTAVFLWDGPPQAGAVALEGEAGQQVSAQFGRCGGFGARGGNCVIDGDTFWYGGEKIRIADINTPEVSNPGCASEAALGEEATERLQALLNEGAFKLETVDRDRDKYGRLLRVVTRDGESLGGVLVDEGLAEEWQGYRRDWC